VRELFSSGHAIDIVLAVVVLEAAVLLGLRLRSGRGLSLLDLLGQLASGVLLLLAVRCALTGADYRVVGALLAASLPLHLFDLWRRLRRPSSG
jgi:hypothetical protein